ncbi:hypothetical protein GSI_15164 [Ganoderma sinense ZZ0214-1]|uniref:Uncharacterized protein n=1 Tax=Ganoderma sinense ZZ0214-1 TaxID=1077348 RepID=A0A2G8RLT1_9APHY|nr:hypothetical protein GSI_15164 [Ganoderma sinense ZZ0214-1]
MYTTSPSNPTARVARSAAGFLDLLHSDTVQISRSICGNPHQDAHSADSSATTPVPLYEPPPGRSSRDAPRRRHRSWNHTLPGNHSTNPSSRREKAAGDGAGMFLGSVLAGHLRPTPADDGSHLEGGDVVDEIQRAYEDVREKYEDGRAYYYGIVKRFEVPGEENEENGRGFWERQR